MAIIPGVNSPSSITRTGTSSTDNGMFAGHLFATGLSKPQILESLLVKFPNYWLLDVAEKLGLKRKIELYNGTYSWSKMGRTRKSSTISAIANGTTAAATLTTDIAYTDAHSSGYWLPGDTFYVVDTGARGRVTSVSNSGGFQTLVVAKIDGTNWATSTINSTHKIGHTGTTFGEGSSASGGTRSYFPTTDYNYSTIARRGIKVTRNMMKDKVYLADGSWYFVHEDFEQKEFMKDIDATLFFGTRYKSSTFGGLAQSRGLLEYAEEEGQEVTFSSSIGAQEADLKLLLENLVTQGGSKNLVLACGYKLFSDLQSALGNNYRPVPTSTFQKATGIDVETYNFIGKEITLMHTDLFDDDAIVPQVAASSTAKDFRNFGILLDMGDVGGGKSNFEVGWVQDVTQKAITGMASDSYEISNAFDGVQMELLAEFMPIVYFPHRLGLLYSNS